MKPGVQIEGARPEHEEAIENLLKKTGLPHRNIYSHLNCFLVAADENRVLGTIALEVYGPDGMLRSLAVEDSRRGLGIGKALYEKAVESARRSGLTALYLLTTSAEEFFRRMGFSRINRERVPAPIRETDHFLTFCPSDAVCMVKKLGV